MRARNPEFESKHKRGKGGQFAAKPNSGQPAVAGIHIVDLESQPRRSPADSLQIAADLDMAFIAEDLGNRSRM